MQPADAFLQAIINTPDDDTPRLVYADWLEENGDAERADFIRVQCALARLPKNDPRCEALEARVRELFSQVVARWLGGRLRQFLEESRADSPIKEQLRRFAADQRALPLLLDLGGCLAIRMDGEVLSFGWDEPENPRIEKDARVRQATLAVGAKKYREVRLLLPPRPVSSRLCPSCGGSGTVASAPPSIVCDCGGLGWIP
jgi:uncharacterized protein (TIGR02996 family)